VHFYTVKSKHYKNARYEYHDKHHEAAFQRIVTAPTEIQLTLPWVNG
jgi:hypothetical protein